MSEVTYTTEGLTCGPVETQQVPFAAGTYYRGQALEYDTVNSRYQNLDSGSIAGIFLGDETTLANDDQDVIIAGGEVYEGGIVNGSGAALTITETMIAAWAVRGFYVKKA